MENRTHFLSIHLKRCDFEAQQLSLRPIVETATGFPLINVTWCRFLISSLNSLQVTQLRFELFCLGKFEQVKRKLNREKKSFVEFSLEC